MSEAYRMILAKTPDGGLDIVSSNRIQITLPGGIDAVDPLILENSSGHFVESMQADGAVLQRQAIDTNIPRHVEYPTGDAERPFAHAEAPSDAVFSILVPHVPGTRRIVFVAQSPRLLPMAEGGSKAAATGMERRELASIDVTEEGQP